MDHDFQKAEAACLAAAVRWDAWAHPDGREPFQERLPLAVLLKAAYSRELRPPAERVWFQAVKLAPQGESVSAQQARQALQLPEPERPQAPVLAAWEQFSEPQAQPLEVLSGESDESGAPGEVLALPV